MTRPTLPRFSGTFGILYGSSSFTKEEQIMAIYRPEDQGLIQPRDPSAIAKQSDLGNISSLAIVLLIAAVAFGLFVFAAFDSTPPRATPPVDQSSPAQPSTQNPTP
jgi:hypothetical protein